MDPDLNPEPNPLYSSALTLIRSLQAWQRDDPASFGPPEALFLSALQRALAAYQENPLNQSDSDL